MSLAPAPSSRLEVRVAGHVLRALEHHVLEQVREPGAARLLVRRTDVIPEVHRHQRQPVILGQDHVEAVRQRVSANRGIQTPGKDSFFKWEMQWK